MKTPRDNGGPAFPAPHSPEPNAGDGQIGMTLRDYFAAQAMQTLLMPSTDGTDWTEHESLAALSYKIADAMIAERSKTK